MLSINKKIVKAFELFIIFSTLSTTITASEDHDKDAVPDPTTAELVSKPVPPKSAIPPQSARSSRLHSSLNPSKLGQIYGRAEGIYYLFRHAPTGLGQYKFVTFNAQWDDFVFPLLQDVVITYKKTKAEQLIACFLLGQRTLVAQHITYQWYREFSFEKLPEYLQLTQQEWQDIWQQHRRILTLALPCADTTNSEYQKALWYSKAEVIYLLFNNYKKPVEYVICPYLPKHESHCYLIQAICDEMNQKMASTFIAEILQGNAKSVLQQVWEKGYFKSLFSDFKEASEHYLKEDAGLPPYIFSSCIHTQHLMAMEGLLSLQKQKIIMHKINGPSASKDILSRRSLPISKDLSQDAKLSYEQLEEKATKYYYMSELAIIVLQTYDMPRRFWRCLAGNIDIWKIRRMQTHINFLQFEARGFKQNCYFFSICKTPLENYKGVDLQKAMQLVDRKHEKRVKDAYKMLQEGSTVAEVSIAKAIAPSIVGHLKDCDGNNDKMEIIAYDNAFWEAMFSAQRSSVQHKAAESSASSSETSE